MKSGKTHIKKTDLPSAIEFCHRFRPETSIHADTGSLIYCAKTSLLGTLAAHFTIYLAPLVIEELRPECPDEFPETKSIIELLERGLLKRASVPPELLEGQKEIPIRSGLHRGEAQVAEIYHISSSGFILTDDARLMSYCRRNDIPFTSSILIPSLLAHHGLLNHENARIAIDAIAKIGFFSDSVIHIATETLKSLTDG